MKNILWEQRAGILFLAFFLLSLRSVAQNADGQSGQRSVPRAALFELGISSEILQGGDYEITSGNGLYERGSTDDSYRTRVNFSAPLLVGRSGKFSLGAFYDYTNMGFVPSNFDAALPTVNFGKEHHTWGFTASGSYRMELFGRQVMGMMNLRGECSERALHRVTGMAMALLPLRRTARSSSTVGLIYLIGTSSPWPLFPAFMYNYKFDEHWSFDFMMAIVRLNYAFSDKDKLSLGTAVGGGHFYIRPQREELPHTTMVGRSNFRPELTFEHKFNLLMRFKLSCGYSVCISSHIYSDSGNTEYADIDHDAAPYLQATISYGLNMF